MRAGRSLNCFPQGAVDTGGPDSVFDDKSVDSGLHGDYAKETGTSSDIQTSTWFAAGPCGQR